MTRLLLLLLTLLFSLSGPAMGEHSDSRQSSFVAESAAAPTGQFYSVAFETKLSQTSYPGVSRYMHFKGANTALDAAISGDAGVAASMEQMGISVPNSSTGSILGKSPGIWSGITIRKPESCSWFRRANI